MNTVEHGAYTTTQAAAILGVSHVAVRRWVAAGQIPSFKIATSRRIRRDVIEAVMDPGAEYPPPGAWETAEDFLQLVRPGGHRG